MMARQLLQRLKQVEDEWSALVGQWLSLNLSFATDDELEILHEYTKKRDSPEEIKLSAKEIATAEDCEVKILDRNKAAYKSRMLTRQNKNFS